jgi:hypothetical protein
MKTYRSASLFTALLTTILFVTVLSCRKEKNNSSGSVDPKCVNVNCNNGTCFQGECACLPGWEGFFCDIKVVSKYMGAWNAIETIVLSEDPGRVGDTHSYIFSVIPDGDEVLSFKIAGLMGLNDTLTASLGDPISRGYDPRGFYFTNKAISDISQNVPLAYIPGGGGFFTSSGSFMDSMAYNRRFEFLNGQDTVFYKDTVRVVAQKI